MVRSRARARRPRCGKVMHGQAQAQAKAKAASGRRGGGYVRGAAGAGPGGCVRVRPGCACGYAGLMRGGCVGWWVVEARRPGPIRKEEAALGPLNPLHSARGVPTRFRPAHEKCPFCLLTRRPRLQDNSGGCSPARTRRLGGVERSQRRPGRRQPPGPRRWAAATGASWPDWASRGGVTGRGPVLPLTRGGHHPNCTVACPGQRPGASACPGPTRPLVRSDRADTRHLNRPQWPSGHITAWR